MRLKKSEAGFAIEPDTSEQAEKLQKLVGLNVKISPNSGQATHLSLSDRSRRMVDCTLSHKADHFDLEDQ